jgi:hypothetical protein
LHLGLGVPVRVFFGYPSSAGSDEATATTDVAYTPFQRFARFELKFSGGGSPPGRSIFTQELYELCDREMRAKGQGSVAEIAAALALTRNESELRPGADECVVNVVACIPARIASFTQTADRREAVVATEVAEDILPRVKLLMTVLNEGWREPISQPIAKGGQAVFALPDRGDVQFTLLFDDYAAQCAKFQRLPLTKPGIRERAVARLEGLDRPLLADGRGWVV